MTLIAFELTDEFAGVTTVYETIEDKDADRGVEVPTYTGGLISAGDRDVDVRELLDTDPHPGLIVADDADTALVIALDDYPALKRTTVPDNVTGIDDLEGRTVADLRVIARQDLGLDGGARASRPALLAAIRRKRELLAAANESEEARQRNSLATSVTELAEAGDPRDDDQAGTPGDTTTEGEAS